MPFEPPETITVRGLTLTRTSNHNGVAFRYKTPSLIIGITVDNVGDFDQLMIAQPGTELIDVTLVDAVAVQLFGHPPPLIFIGAELDCGYSGFIFAVAVEESVTDPPLGSGKTRVRD